MNMILALLAIHLIADPSRGWSTRVQNLSVWLWSVGLQDVLAPTWQAVAAPSGNPKPETVVEASELRKTGCSR